jgi:hypothetical protein
MRKWYAFFIALGYWGVTTILFLICKKLQIGNDLSRMLLLWWANAAVYPIYRIVAGDYRD